MILTLRNHSTRRWLDRILAAACRCAATLGFVVLAVLIGCSKPANQPKEATQSSPKSSNSSKPSIDPQEVLTKLKQVYRELDSYTDNTAVVYAGVSRATGSLKDVAFTRSSLAFARPNRINVTHQRNLSGPNEERFDLVSNGSTIRSATDYPADQVHEAIAPKTLTAENFVPEPAFRAELLALGLENTFPQLTLLLNAQDDQPVFDGESEAQMLNSGELDGKKYYRVELPSPLGKRVLWVDQETSVMRRMEVPIENQQKQLSAALQSTDVAVWIDFEDVVTNADLKADMFALAVPEGARRVRRFIPPPPEGPPEFLGQPVGQFSFTSLDAESVTPETLAGKVTILDFWSTICPPCRKQTPVLNEVYEHFQTNEEVEFLAVSTDRRAVRDDAVENTLREWGGDMPVVRDLSSSGYHDLNIRSTPTMILVDQEGRVQSFLVGAHRTSNPIIDTVQRLVDGENIAATDRAKHAEYVVKYEEALDAMEIKDSILEVEIVQPEIGERVMPESLQLTELWQTSPETLQHPGDLRMVTHESWGPSARLMAMDGGQAVVELSFQTGELLGRHELPDHDEQSRGFLRHWINAEGMLWTLASGVGWQQAYVLDPDWQPVLSFPDEDHSGIGDVLFDDLTGSGTPIIYVGYWGGLGVQGGTLDGLRLWTNRRLDHVVQIGEGPTVSSSGDAAQKEVRTVWCTSTRGTLTEISAVGKALRERYVEGQALMYFASAVSGERHCGLSVDSAGQYTAVGFGDLEAVDWEYPLPKGEYVEPLPRIHEVNMPDGSSAWLVIAANGSLHWLTEDGQLIDRFDYGEILTGVAATTLGDASYLFVATKDHLTAWELSTPAPVTSPEPVENEEPEVESPPAEPETSESAGSTSSTGDETSEP